MNVDVLVIGAGPAGGTLSLLLAKSGLNVLMVDSKKSVGKKSCSGILGYECLKELPVRTDPFVISEIKMGVFESPGGVEIEFEGNIAKVVDRVSLDREIVEAALSHGARIRLGSRFIGIEDKKAIIWNENGSERISYRYLVGADGVHSKVRDVLGLQAKEPYIGIQVFSEEKMIPDDRFKVRIKRGSRFLWIYPWRDRSRVGALGKSTDPIMKWVRGEVPNFLEKEVAAIPSTPLKHFQKGNVALVGDAAGQVKPLSRGGIYLGVKGARLLASSILESYERDLPLIEGSYQKEWWKLFGFEIKAGLAFRNVLDRMNPRELDSLFFLLKGYEKRVSSFDIDHQLTSVITSINASDFLRAALSKPKLLLKLLSALILNYFSYF